MSYMPAIFGRARKLSPMTMKVRVVPCHSSWTVKDHL